MQDQMYKMSNQKSIQNGIKRGKDLVFRNVNVDIAGKKTLQDVSGIAKKGEMLAVIGPSGAGKTTLFNSLLLKVPMTSGHVTLDNEAMTRQHCRKIAYCVQDDVFIPTLTLRETLYFRAELSLPEKMSRSDKDARIKDVTDTLDLESCLETPMGSPFLPGLSGGQKRRANIACELINNPQVMLLDEPTSGLDSAIAYSIVESLRSHTVSSNKTLLISIHQPSTQIFYLFKSLLLIADGQVAYFGRSDGLMSHLENIGLHCKLHYNPADFVLEKLKNQKSDILSSSSLDLQKSNWPRELTRDLPHTETKSASTDNVEISILEENGIKAIGYVSRADGTVEVDAEPKAVAFDEFESSRNKSETRKWPTTFWTQFKTLTQRQFKISKGNIFNKFGFLRYSSFTIITCIMWWQIARTEERMNEKFALCYFPLVYLMFDISTGASTAFCSERGLVRKERSRGLYRLSAYYFAKMITELLMVFVLPGIYVIVTYFACNLTLVPANFFSYMGIVWLHCLVSQSCGLFSAMLCEDPRAALSLNSLIMLPQLVAGGFYIRNFPSWLSWFQYLTYNHYSFRSMSIVEFAYGDPIRCAPANQTIFEFCKQDSNDTLYIPRDQVLSGIPTGLPLWANALMNFSFFMILRISGYVIFRFFKRPSAARNAQVKKKN